MKSVARFSLVRRITILVLSVSLASLLLHFFLVVFLVKPMADNMVVQLNAQIALARLALASVPPNQRESIVISLQKLGVKASRTKPLEGDNPASGLRSPPLFPPLMGSPAQPLRPPRDHPTSELPLAPLQGFIPHHMLSQSGIPSVYFETNIGTEQWWFSLSKNPSMAASSPLIPIGLLILLVGLMAALSLVAGVRMITRPMAELSAQLLSRCDQLSPIDPPRNGSLELDRVIASFNQLVMAVGHANEVRRNMLAGLSHDLRTPLARLQLRVDCECPEEVSRRLTPDFDALSKILSQFLAFARSDGKVSLGAEVAVGAIARQIVGQFSSTDFDVTLVEGGDLVVGMPELAMHRILSNLIDNALEHGSAPVRVFLSEKAHTLKIVVLDAGAGIPDHLFKLAQEPFTKLRGDQTTLGHSGLGLAIVAQITDQLKGKLLQCNVDGFAGLAVHLPVQRNQESVPKQQ